MSVRLQQPAEAVLEAIRHAKQAGRQVVLDGAPGDDGTGRRSCAARTSYAERERAR